MCGILGISDHRQAIEKLDTDEIGGYKIPTTLGERNMSCINEPGLYSLIIRSNKPEAKKFKRWITHDVLPVIRKDIRDTIIQLLAYKSGRVRLTRCPTR